MLHIIQRSAAAVQLSAIPQYTHIYDGGSHDQRFSDSACCRLIGLHCNLQIAAFNPLKPSGHCMYHQFNIQRFYVLPTDCIFVFCVDLRTNSHYFPIQH